MDAVETQVAEICKEYNLNEIIDIAILACFMIGKEVGAGNLAEEDPKKYAKLEFIKRCIVAKHLEELDNFATKQVLDTYTNLTASQGGAI